MIGCMGRLRFQGALMTLGAAFFFMAQAACAQPTEIEYAWNNGADFRFGHTYGATVNASAVTEEAALTVGYRRIYQIPNLSGTGTLWMALPAKERLPRAVAKHAVVTAGDYVYVIAGKRALVANSTCTTSEGPPIATVRFARLNPDGSLGVKPCPDVTGGCWQESVFEYGQRLGDAGGFPVFDHQAVAVQNVEGRWRVYVSGGSTIGGGESHPDPGQYGVARVYSALQDPVTGDLGPWEEEINLGVPIAGHSMVYAGGALFVFGGTRVPDGRAEKIVQRADIIGEIPGASGLPNTLRGSLNPQQWDTLPDMPPGSPGQTYELCGEDNNNCRLCPQELCPDINDDTVCREEVGWIYMNATAVMRSFMFAGAGYLSGWSHSCNFYPGGYVAHLDDCNVPSLWRDYPGANPAIAYPAMRIIAHNDVVLGIGSGPDRTSPSRRVFYNHAYAKGVFRDVTSPDDMNVRLGVPNGIELIKAEDLQREVFPVPAMFVGLVAWRNFAYVIGLNEDSSKACNKVFRASLPEAREFSELALTRPRMEEAYYLSPPYDLTKLAEEKEWPGPMPEEWEIKKVSWKFQKTGYADNDDNDDWAMVRYRVANPDGDWSYEGCAGGWAPRTPVEGTLPAVPGEYEYSSDLPDNSVYYQPRFTNPVRYIQFEISLYNNADNDCPTATAPIFKEFKIVFAPASFKVETELPDRPLETYPSPATDSVSVAFGIEDGGGELIFRIYNVAGKLIFRQDFRYTSGGPKRETLDTSRFAPGVYVLVAESRGTYGGGALKCIEDQPGDPPRSKVTSRFVIRR